MTNLSREPLRPLLNIPLPAGSKPASTYSRIIPAEELGDFNAWQPDALVSTQAAMAHPLWIAQDRNAEAATEPAPVDLDKAVAEANKAGYEEGYRDGLKALETFKKTHAEKLQAQSALQLEQWLTKLDAQWAQLEPRMAECISQTAVKLARQVLRQELQTQPEHVVGMAREAVQALSSSARRIELQVHPDDLPLVQQGLGEMLQSRGGRVLADAGIARGGCRAQADIAAVDATLERRWADAAAALGSTLALNDEAEAEAKE